MKKIKRIKKVTENPFVNLYNLDAVNRKGKEFTYYVASRAKEEEQLKLKTRKNEPDGVAIFSLYGEKHDRMVLVRQYRYSIDDFIYEMPAGLVDAGETYGEAAVREMREETGLIFTPLKVPSWCEKPRFTTIGLTDESCATVYGYSNGEVSAEMLEDSEDLEVVLADRAEVKRILKEEHVAIMAAYMMMHFLHDEETFDFLTE